VQHECTTDNTGNTDLFMCIPTDYDEPSLDQARLLDYFNRQYNLMPSDGGYATKPTDMHSRIMNKWNVYLLALGDIIGLKGSSIVGPRIGLCGNNLNMTSSRISSSGRGCRAGQGLGAGLKIDQCAGSGASHGGYGGHGGSESNDAQEKATCMRSYPKPYYFG
jgi:hypothetical protein